MQDRLINSRSLGEMLAYARNKGNKSQKYMASHLTKSIATIQSWESGLSAPNIIDTLKWFEILGINPLRGLLSFLFPSTYYGLRPEHDDENIRKALIHYIQNVAPNSEVRKLAYNIFGDTGSSWAAQLDMLTAHNHTSLASRVRNGESIVTSYELEKCRGELINPQNILPDEDNLREAIHKCRISAIEGKDGYNF